MKKALVLAGGLPQIELIQELKRRGYYTILADYYENPIARTYADRFYRKSTLDIPAMREIATTEKVDMIITCCTDQALLTVSTLSEELGLPCYVNAEMGLAVTNKAYMKEVFKKNNIPTADYQIIKQEESVQLKYPLVVKPVDCNSSKGVVKVETDAQLQVAIQNAKSFSRTHTAVVEEFIQGDEISVDAFVRNGKVEILCHSVSYKISSNDKFIIYKGQYPSPLTGQLYQRMEKIVQQIADAFHLKTCPMLVQMLKRNDDIYVVEFSARTGGCAKYKMIELASGVDVIKATVDVFENKEPVYEIHHSNKVVVNEFVYAKPGEFSCVKGFNECVQEGLLVSYDVLHHAGDTISGVQSSGDRVVAMTYVADSQQDYVEKHNKVVECIKIEDSYHNNILQYDFLPRM